MWICQYDNTPLFACTQLNHDLNPNHPAFPIEPVNKILRPFSYFSWVLKAHTVTMATTVTLNAIKPLSHKPIFQIPPEPPAIPSTYFKSPFDPEKHLIYNGIPKRHTMEELSFPPNQGISSIAVSEPFELFSKEAVKHIRNEVLSDDVWDNCRFASSIAACQLRGTSPKYVFCPFNILTFCLICL